MKASLCFSFCFLFSTAGFQFHAAAGERLQIVEAGKPKAVLLVAEDEQLRQEAKRFSTIVEKATGVELSIYPAAEEAAIPDGMNKVYIGPSSAVASAGLKESYPVETYQIKTQGNSVYILGHYAPIALPQIKVESKPIRWAINDLLSSELGVRWLWPGELGTFIPKRKGFSIPPQDKRYQPKLLIRKLRANMLYARRKNPDEMLRKVEREAFDWLENHQAGERGNLVFEHAFSHWWDKYSAQHPDYFAEPLPGVKQPYPKAGSAKLRLANPAVIEAIAREYQEAGAPNYYDVGPNDGSGFDISAATRAWDIPKDQAPEDIWGARGNLTARYVEFWNRLYKRLHQINPDLIMGAFAYSSYSEPPPPERPVTARMYFSVVNMPYDFEQWQGWKSNAAGMFLRPNWWHFGAGTPYLPLDDYQRFIAFAWKNSLMGIDMDSILGTWATQGISYYMVARMMTNPELTKDEVINDYAQAFGPASEKIKEYLAYWENVTKENGYPHLGGPNRVKDQTKAYGRLLAEEKIPGDLTANHSAMPYLYTNAVLAPAQQLLKEAAQIAGAPDSEAAQRVEFLRLGLEELIATRDAMIAGKTYARRRTAASLEDLKKKDEELHALRRTLTPQHVVWGDYMETYENRYKIKIRPQNFPAQEVNLDGQF